METFTLIELLSAVAGSFLAGMSVGNYWGSSKTASTMPMRCKILVDYALSLKGGDQVKVKPINVEAINGKNKRCDCLYLEKNKHCSISTKRCDFF